MIISNPKTFVDYVTMFESYKIFMILKLPKAV